MIKGYLNRVEATKESITEGWLHTGDVATIDDTGFIFTAAQDHVFKIGRAHV